MFRKAIAVAALLLAFAALDPAAAQRTRTGVLSCDVSAGFGFIIGSQRSVICTFSPDGGQPEVYTGTISRFGLDIGVTAGAHMVWGVFAEYVGPRPRRAGRRLCRRHRRGDRSRSVSAPMCWSAARTARLRCSRSRSADRSGSILRSASPICACGRAAERIENARLDATAAQRAAVCVVAHREFARRAASRLLPIPPSVETIAIRPLQRAASQAAGRRKWHRTAHEPRVPGASRWWARSRAARPRCSKQSSRAPARSSVRAPSMRVPPSATPARKRATTT